LPECSGTERFACASRIAAKHRPDRLSGAACIGGAAQQDGDRRQIDGAGLRSNPKLWAECVVGALVEQDYLNLFREVGFAGVSVLRSFDYFSGSASADTRRIAGALGAHAVEIRMQRPVG
jgi:hypothetical protein